MSLADGLMRLVKGVQGAGGIDAIMGALERKRQAEEQERSMARMLELVNGLSDKVGNATQKTTFTDVTANPGQSDAILNYQQGLINKPQSILPKDFPAQNTSTPMQMTTRPDMGLKGLTNQRGATTQLSQMSSDNRGAWEGKLKETTPLSRSEQQQNINQLILEQLPNMFSRDILPEHRQVAMNALDRLTGKYSQKEDYQTLGKGQKLYRILPDGNIEEVASNDNTVRDEDLWVKIGEGTTEDGKFATMRNKYTGEEQRVRLGDKERTASTNINVNTGTAEIDVSKDRGEITRLLEEYKKLSTTPTSYMNKEQVEGKRIERWSQLKGKTDEYAAKLQIIEDVGEIWRLLKKGGINVEEAIAKIDFSRKRRGEPALTAQQREGITFYFKARNFDGKTETTTKKG